LAAFGDEHYERALHDLPGVLHVAKPPPTSASANGSWYVNLLAALEHALALATGCEGCVVNLSLGLRSVGSGTFDPNEPINTATRLLHERGVVVIVAAGNDGEFGDDTMSTWARAPWVISVAASDIRGKRLDVYSSRGIPGHPSLHPTVTAPGVRSWTGHGDTGTSFAAPQVTDIALSLLAFGLDVWKRSAQFLIPYDQARQLLTAFVRRALEEMAKPMNALTHECGAGFVSHDTAAGFLKAISLVQLSNLMRVPHPLNEQALRCAKDSLRKSVQSMGSNYLKRISIDTTFEWTLPSFVPGLLRRPNGHMLSRIERIDRGNEIDFADTRSENTMFTEISIYPRAQRGRTLRVGKGTDSAFQTIGAALIEALEWDTILIGAGEYVEIVKPRSGVNIVGEDGAIISHPTNCPFMLLGVKAVSLRNLEIVSHAARPACIVIFQSRNVSIDNCRLSSGGNGITGYKSERVQLTGCNISAENNAGFWAFCRSIRIRNGCYLIGRNIGLLLYACSAEVTNCAITGSNSIAILYVQTNLPWSSSWLNKVFAGHEGVIPIWPGTVKPSSVHREDVIGCVARLSYGLTIDSVQLIGATYGLAASSFESVLYKPDYVEAGESNLATIKGSRALPVAIRGLEYDEAVKRIEASMNPLAIFPR
jgi:hypothetical protein